ncbi:diguanylate cyclase (GGDEF)-like protein/PAS domain S-box-containing protein [Variovorax boronicumulans]|uniref:PAS domain-containing protein n=1 Tax=Variovorax boronicumulans TaxID=436515 RepID=UPI00277D540E|nr:PAS domain-containing protein [Variovorax boronicumulans]MDP9992655.1 diguanylate cyclase (GGDEF)-like protein/PAS domain S-box-containing protein [Variovorax boronicumulans]MDQ0004254.1 diguanylate cyclase (GGDEF)-like protein/PAS domain S-box-containing protein [Variovorax boronicumulans]
MQKPALSAPQVAGILVGLLGVATATRWIFQVDAIGRLIPGSEQVGIVNPLLFIAVGICFFNATLPQKSGGWLTRLSAICIAALIALPLAYLFESASGIGLGVDFVRAGTIPTATNPHPGRLSPNASLAFLLTGVAFWLHGRRPTRVGELIFLTLVLAVSIIGLGGLVGYLVGLETLYQVASVNRMLPLTAVGISVVGGGLWMLHEGSQAFDRKALDKSERRIKRRSLAVIIFVALAGGVAGFAVMRDTFEQSISQNMLLTATTNATSLGHALDASLWFPRTVVTRPTVREVLEKLGKAPGDAAAKDALQKAADSFLTADLTGLEIFDANGMRLVQAGVMVRAQAQIVQRLANAGQTAVLAWKDGYVLLTENDVLVDGRTMGRVFTEQRMPLFDSLLADVRASSDTSDVAICGRDNDTLICAPNRFRPSGFELPMFNAAGGAALPVARALLGERGVQFLKDRRGVNILSAFTPIRNFGLGLAIRTDVETLYAPLRARLKLLALALVGIVALAVYAQHSQVRPVLKQLVASEQRVKAILEDQSELVSLATPDGELTYVNPAYARHFGLTPAAMTGANLFDYVEPEDRVAVRQVVAQVLSTGTTVTSENRMTAANGTQRWVAWTHSLQRDRSGEPMLHSVGRDVTERKQTELALRASQELLTEKSALLEATLERMEQGVMMVNAARVVEVCNRRAVELLDLPKDLMASKPTFEAVLAYQWATDEFVHTPQDVQEFVRQGGILDRPHSYDRKRPDGRAIEIHSVPIEGGGVLRTYTDVTERKLAESAMRALTAIFDATTDYVVQLDMKGRITYMNPAARHRTGVALDASLEHRTLEDFNPPHTLDRFISEVWPAAVATGVWVGESVVWDAARREFPVSHIVIAHRDKEGKVEYFSALMRDISAAKAAEQALRDSEHRLRMVTDHLPVLISYLDRDLRFRFLNQTYQEWFGEEAAPQIGTSVREFYGEQAWVQIEPRLRAALAGQDVAYDREMVRPDGGLRHVQVTVVPDRDEQDTVVGLYTLIHDVTSYREAQRALQESEARLRTVTDVLPMRVAYIDSDERYRFNNLAYERGFGRSRQEIHGQTVRALLGDAAYTSVEPHIRSALRGEAVTFLSEIASGDSHVYYEAQYIPQLAADGSTVLGFHAVVSDITRQKIEERRLTELARVDPLTGVINRAGFELRVAEAIERCRATGALMALMYLDIDRFKQINDRFGHNAGDALLRAFSGRLSQTLRSSDTVARLGGDEFTVIMEGLPRPEIASVVAAKIVEAMSTPFVIDQQTFDVTASIGIAFYQGGATTVEGLVRQADAMLYQAKGAGRNNVQVALQLVEDGNV